MCDDRSRGALRVARDRSDGRVRLCIDAGGVSAFQHVLGKNHFYESDNALIRSTHGLIYLKEMDINEFITLANELKKRSEGF